MPISEIYPTGETTKGIINDEFDLAREQEWEFTHRGVSAYAELFLPLLEKMRSDQWTLLRRLKKTNPGTQLKELVPQGGSYLDLFSFTGAAREMGARVSLCVSVSDPRIMGWYGETKENLTNDTRRGIFQLLGKAQDPHTWEEIESFIQTHTPGGFDLVTEIGEGALKRQNFPSSSSFLEFVANTYSILAPNGTALLQIPFQHETEDMIEDLAKQLDAHNVWTHFEYPRTDKNGVTQKAVVAIQKNPGAPKSISDAVDAIKTRYK